MGIDISEDAVELTQSRLLQPIRSDSLLLELGRESYRKAEQSALMLLDGLDYVPVHRNTGIDAILKQDLDGTPVPIRVQRRGETVTEAAQKLYRASAPKGAKVMFLLVLAKNGCFEFTGELPAGVVAMKTPAIEIGEYLSRLREKNLRPTQENKEMSVKSKV